MAIIFWDIYILSLLSISFAGPFPTTNDKILIRTNDSDHQITRSKLLDSLSNSSLDPDSSTTDSLTPIDSSIKVDLAIAPTTLFPRGEGFNNSCIRYDLMSTSTTVTSHTSDDVIPGLSNERRLQTFKTERMSVCWQYCSIKDGCAVFEYNVITRRCSLFPQIMTKKSRVPKYTLAVAQMSCLDCLQSVEIVMEHSKHGVLIKNQSGKLCLSTRQKSEGTVSTKVDNSTRVHLTWIPCSKADTWTLTRTGETSNQSRENGAWVEVSKFNSSLVLDWELTPEEWALVYLTKKSSLSQNKIHFSRSYLYSGLGCRFRFLGFGMTLFPKTGSLDGISILVPSAITKCPLQQFSVANGEVINENKVPYFLEGSSVSIQCRTGFGVKALNYSYRQVIRCSQGIRPRPCSTLTPVNKREHSVTPDMEIYLGIIVVLSVVLIMGAVGVLGRNCGKWLLST